MTDLYIATLQYADGRREQFDVSEDAFETLSEYLEAVWLYLPAEDGLVFVKTEGLQWLTIMKDELRLVG